MAQKTIKTKMTEKEFEERMTKLDRQYQLLLAQMRILEDAIQNKEEEIQCLLDEWSGIK